MKKIKWLSLAALMVALVSFFIHPFGRVKATTSAKPFFSGAQVEAPVLNIMQRSCQNCHSEQTVWPWYSYIPPASWLLEKDVRDAREHFNMSHWDEYSPKKRIETLGEISARIRNKRMPPPRYTLLHPEAKLTHADVGMIDHWSHAERRRLSGSAGEQAAAPD